MQHLKHNKTIINESRLLYTRAFMISLREVLREISPKQKLNITCVLYSFHKSKRARDDFSGPIYICKSQ